MPAKRFADGKVPVTVLTGYLGSGKTTLLNHILSSKEHGLRVAVIENEFGAVGVDDALVRRKLETKEDIFEMNNGCLCCTVRGDLIRILKKILVVGENGTDQKPFDAIIIETTGLADPAPVAQTFFMEEDVKRLARLDAIVTVVDAKHIVQHVDEVKPDGVENEAVEQIAFADRIILNKTDLVDEAYLDKVEARLTLINPNCEQLRCSYAEVPLNKILGIEGFDLKRVLELEPAFLDENAGSDDHVHDNSIISVGIRETGDVDFRKLNVWISTFLRTRGSDVYRMKGVFAIKGMPVPFVFQGVHMTFHGKAIRDEPWESEDARENRAIFIGRNLDAHEIVQSFRACIHEDRPQE